LGTLKLNVPKMAQKRKNPFYKLVLELYIATINLLQPFLTFVGNFEAKCAKNGSKKEKSLYKLVLELYFATIKRVGVTRLLKQLHPYLKDN
jgi:hypothetical protein